MRRGWIGFCCLAALGAATAFAADEAGKPDVGPSLEYRPPKPILPEPKGPTPAPPVTLFAESYGGFGIGRGSFDGPLDVAIGGAGSVYALDAGNSRVQMFTSKNDFVLEWGSYGADERRGQFKKPSAIVVVPRSCELVQSDVVLVVDTGNNRIQWFRVPCKGDPTKLPNLPVGHADSVFRTYGVDFGDLGEKGIADGKFNGPLDIAFEEPLPDGVMLWVLDAGNQRLQRFALEYDRRKLAYKLPPVFVDQINNLSGERGNLKGLVSVAWARERSFSYLYLLGAGCSLQKFKLATSGGASISSAMNLTAALPALEEAWPAVAPESELCVPARIRYDQRKEYVYVLDSGNSMLSIFHRYGNYISAIRGANRSFDRPGGFAFVAESGQFAVADTGNDLVQKFTLR